MRAADCIFNVIYSHSDSLSGCPLIRYHSVSCPRLMCVCLKVRVKLRNFADLDFDLDPNWGIKPKIETLYNLSCLPDIKNPKNI